MTAGILLSHIGCRVIAGVVAMVLLLTGTTFGEEWLEEYDPVTDQWLIRAPMPTPRSATTWGVFEGHIYVAGRRDPTP